MSVIIKTAEGIWVHSYDLLQLQLNVGGLQDWWSQHDSFLKLIWNMNQYLNMKYEFVESCSGISGEISILTMWLLVTVEQNIYFYIFSWDIFDPF